MEELSRRHLLGGLLGGPTAVALFAAAAQDPAPRPEMRPYDVIDANVHLFQWPFRRLPLDTVQAMVEKMKELGIAKALAGSFEGLLHRDIAGVNARLTEACRQEGSGRLIPVGAINPALPDWEEDLRRCHEEHRMSAVRVYPSYHDYDVADERFLRLLTLASDRHLVVQVCVSMEDARTQHPKLQVADLDLRPLPDAMKRVPRVRVMLLNYKANAGGLKTLSAIEGLSIDSARVEGTDGIAKVVRSFPLERVVFGTHAPFFIYESALIKVLESELTSEEEAHLFSKNIQRILESTV